MIKEITMTTLWECLWKTSAIVVGVWLVTLLLRRRSAALRHIFWLCGLAAFIVVPALLPLARRTPPLPLAVHMPVILDTMPILPAAPAAPVRSKPASVFPMKQSLPWIWVAGSLMLGIRRTRAVLRMKRIAVRSAPAPLLAPDVRISGEVRTPLTFGFLRPLILLPPCALDWSAGCLCSVLEHEREHIRRLDPLSHWLAELVCAAWWFHPLVWLARSRAAHERECACDDAVLRSGVRPTDYASELLNLASTLTTQGEPVMALSALSDFERRIKNLLLPGIDRRSANTRARLAVALATLVVVVPLAVLRAQAPAGQGDLSGTVTDPSGARVPNAFITASGSHGNREVTRADLAGAWTLSGIPEGSYTVEVIAPGFAMANGTIELATGQRATLNQSLRVGAVQQTINVIGQGQARNSAIQSSSNPEPIRVGGMVQATKLIRQVKPMYPQSAKAQGIEGTVLMKAIIAKDGSLLSLTVMNKLADPDLAAAALDAVKQWRYEPTLLNGEPVEVVTTITVNFTLQM
jgi:TonB family protein